MKKIKINNLFVLVMVAGTWACKPEVKTVIQTQDVPEVDVIQVKSYQPVLQVVLPGELKPWERAEVFPKVKGYVANIHVDRGTAIRKGDVLAVLEAPELEAALNQAKAEASLAEAAFMERTARQRASKNTYKRMLQTGNTRGAISENELDVAYATMMADSALLSAAEGKLRATQAHWQAQQQLVSYLTIRAPFNGIITERNISPGDLVGPESGLPLFVAEDISRLRLTVAVPENLANSITSGIDVDFSVHAEPLKQYHAKFGRSANSLQEKNRTMMTEFDFVNTNTSLKAGMYAEVNLPVKRNNPTLFVPATAVLHTTEGLYVLKVTEGITKRIRIQKGNALDSLVEVFGPIAEDERIVKVAHDELRAGQPVRERLK